MSSGEVDVSVRRHMKIMNMAKIMQRKMEKPAGRGDCFHCEKKIRRNDAMIKISNMAQYCSLNCLQAARRE